MTAAVALAQPLIARELVTIIGEDGVTSTVVVGAGVLVVALVVAAALSGVQAYGIVDAAALPGREARS